MDLYLFVTVTASLGPRQCSRPPSHIQVNQRVRANHKNHEESCSGVGGACTKTSGVQVAPFDEERLGAIDHSGYDEILQESLGCRSRTVSPIFHSVKPLEIRVRYE
ncbi:uncharacterized protein BO95DRAFT_22014 [Aspergillus brunneoviolaceus CBS 621.78]|uniref:Uncharacterized protein n=1 Tax=Aspergillus brunneoviolaceus CBS 621.78 TaxID=1450534 RepID=A0ACD1FTC1_9EURO|nr:hypothetical protein BO95DRAFT_22014 [Aspergillus brunneoviolaceus CBS 621.78]RAH40223.1 hypothetical protein BO95DRAFT_22014 [Aspergillus brunneoviolaceus CBS 621.78]